MTFDSTCSVCKGAGGCPNCRGSGLLNGRRCLICRGAGNCPLCGRAFDPNAPPLERVADKPKVAPRDAILASATRVSSVDAPVTLTRWSDARLTARAILALLVLMAFYVFALASVALLLFITWLQVAVLSRQRGSVLVLGGLIIPPFAALGIVLAILPRGPRFGYPGRGLNPKRAPELFACLRDVARQTHQKMPRAIYLFNDANAFVADRGLFLGRAMGLGLPLFDELTVDELRAIVAHEFGHEANRTGPITRTVYRATRTFAAASAAAGAVPFLDGVFEAWTEVFLRVAMPISRQYELRCDELACRIAGVDATVSALTRISNMGGNSEIANPVAGWEEDLHSTHPPLRDRVAIARALSLPPRAEPADSRPARVLLQGILKGAEEPSPR